jgi:uncharacterized protein YukE
LRKDFIVDPAVKNLADSYEQLTTTTKELADKNIINEVTKAKIETYGEVGRVSMDKVHSSVEKIHNLNEQLQNQNVSATDKNNIENQLSSASTELKNGLNEVNNTLKSIIEIAKGDSSSSYIDLDSIPEFISKFQMFIDQLSQEQKFAVIHISFNIAILFCLFTLVGIHSGDKFIEYFKLEARYPKLAKYFYIRSRIKTYSVY